METYRTPVGEQTLNLDLQAMRRDQRSVKTRPIRSKPMTATHIATCNCGSVRIIANGPPVRIGLCHCTTCRKGSGAPFTANAIWTADSVTVEGKTANWKATTVARHFCPRCGSALFGVSDGTDEIAIQLGVFDAAPTDLAPTYELWVARRERWLPMLPGAKQYDGNRA
jgi:hypothetical protein